MILKWLIKIKNYTNNLKIIIDFHFILSFLKYLAKSWKLSAICYLFQILIINPYLNHSTAVKFCFKVNLSLLKM